MGIMCSEKAPFQENWSSYSIFSPCSTNELAEAHTFEKRNVMFSKKGENQSKCAEQIKNVWAKMLRGEKYPAI